MNDVVAVPSLSSDQAWQLSSGSLRDPFSVLGPFETEVGRFIRAFADKGRLHEMLTQIEVRVALNEATGLIGAAWCAASVL